MSETDLMSFPHLNQNQNSRFVIVVWAGFFASSMWHLFVPSLHFLLFLHMKCSFGQTDCQWRAVVNSYSNLGGPGLIFYNQTHIASVMEAFTHLTDSAVDADDKNAHYYGFPYFLKVDLVCIIENSERAIRMAHYTGLSPTVTVAFQQPVHAVLQKQERLHIELFTAAYRYEGCDSEEVCKMSWFIPMPLMNGSAVMDVQVTSNSLGLMVDDKRFAINVNGFTAVNEKNEVVFKIGTKLSNLKNFLSMKHPSRPLWYTYKQAPVLILGGVPDSKVVIISDSEFENFFPVEVGIDSCWIGSLSCPQIRFSSSIVDAIATESTLFIRQNQLVYYFTGSYQTLYMTKPGSELWTRILNNVCVKKLCPVLFEGNETEYVIAIAGGWEEGHFYIISTKDGEVTVSKSIKGTSPDGKEQTVCEFLKVSWCSILWADFAIQDNVIIFLVNYSAHVDYTVSVVVYMPGKKTFQELYKLPKFVPADSDNGLVMLLGIERYSNIPMVARGLSLNPYSHVVYIWGNIILQSKDLANYLYFSNFPSRAFIKYFVISFQGQFACVTDNEEVWVSIEGGSAIKLVYPTQAWDVFTTLRVMSGHRDYAYPHGLVSIFFDKDGLNELVYIERPDGTELLTKREFPLGKILTYDQIIGLPYRKITYEGANHVKFSQMCPIADLRLVNLPAPQFFTRIEHYSTKPPEVMDKTMFHNEHALHVFQGLIYQLLWLHSDYNRPYADPVHDPTWRWWKDKKQDSEYYTYLASNRNSSGGVFVDMNSYLKIYHLEPRNSLPKLIYLDKQAVFSFGVYLSIRTAKQSMGDSQNTLTSVWLTVVLAHPEYLSADLQREELISRGGVLYTVSIKDTGAYPFQALSGKNLHKTSFAIKVVRSGMNCYHYTGKGPELKGSNFVAVRIGCPPGKRLAFDITGTLELVTRMNKRYFDCVKTDPEMPCFFFSDVFYPLFLIQDMVTGDSGPFNGSYILKVIGGGPHKEENIRYFNDSEIQLYNAANESDISNLIWVRATEGEGKDGNLKDQVDKEGFQILSRNQSGIQWVCQKNSPCYGITPQGLRAPEYFFVIKVTNRGVDQTTYCDYALEFIIHVHGLRLSPKLAIFILQHSVVTAISFVVLYILIYILGPKVAELFSRLTRRIEEAFASRIESSLTFSSSYTSQGSLQNVPSSTSETHSQKTAKGIV